MRRSYCAGSTRRSDGVDADALQVLDIGTDDALEAAPRRSGSRRRAFRLARSDRRRASASSRRQPGARARASQIARGCCRCRRSPAARGLAEHLRRQLVAEWLEQRQLLGRRRARRPSCRSSRRSSPCACRARRTDCWLLHSKSKARSSAWRTRGSLNFSRRVLMKKPCAPEGRSSGSVSAHEPALLDRRHVVARRPVLGGELLAEVEGAGLAGSSSSRLRSRIIVVAHLVEVDRGRD